jgi:hypothetical protein
VTLSCPYSPSAFELAREHAPVGFSPDDAVAAVEDVHGSIGDTCPECPGRRLDCARIIAPQRSPRLHEATQAKFTPVLPILEEPSSSVQIASGEIAADETAPDDLFV